ncbi:hypothetical protein BJV82DRAFT_715401 [Fennellomyces sp. T-0311]|nr:hypothetical protein BJV82DRAFT_715401 [Fennellomyces sp. T-0311]
MYVKPVTFFPSPPLFSLFFFLTLFFTSSMTSAVRGGTHWQHHNRWEDDGYREIHLDDNHDRRRPSPEREIEEEEEEDEDEMIIEDASSMSSSPSIPDENINFDLVYALHTFVATVEGQASVVKGDALILMEDTNIYWWLVEVLKTREVGYIPAENIETPYERLARLNKHRNVEITSPSDANEFVQLEKKSRKNVTIATGAGATRVIHYEVESEEEPDESGAEEDHANDDEDDDDDDDDAFEDAHQDIIEEQPQVHHQQYNADLLAVPEQAEAAEELRVFAGNIGQAPLFHTFSISLSTTADVLVREAATRFDLYSRPEYAEGTIEYYIAVQGLDGDDYVLAPQDKPLSIFKTLTAPLTTPMPSVSHIRRTSPQQQQPGIGVNSAAAPSSLPAKNEGRSRRPRSSSFSNYEQTSYDEDSVIRFYLHRRIKRAHEREGIFYIKVSLYPDESSSTGMPPASTNAPAFTTNPTPASSSGKKKKLISSRQEIDRIDKIMAVKQEQQIGSVITMALEKFHVPDAEADGYFSQQAMMGPTDRCLTKYRMSVRANGIENRLDPRDHMASALHKQQAHGPVTSDLLFILRRADESQPQQEYPPPLLSPVGGNKFNHDSDMMMPEERRPSILDILMDSPRSTEDRRPSFMKGPMTPVDDRRPSLPSSLATSSSQEQQRKSSLTPPCQQGATLTPPPISGFRRTSVMSGTSSVYSDCPPTAMDHSSSWDGLAAPSSSSSSSIARSASLQPGDAATVAAQQMQRSTTSTNNAKKESSFKQQLKRLVGWGSKSKKSPPPPLESPSSSSLMMMQQNGSSLSVKPTPSSPFLETTASQVSIVSAPPTPLTPTPGKNAISSKALSPRREDHPPATPIKDRPHLSPVAAAASASATSMIDPAVATESHVSSLSSLSSDDDDDDDVEVGKETVDLSDDSDDSSSDEEEEDKPPKPPPKGEPLSDIQAQYTMWMDSQKSDQPGEKRASKTECEPPSNEPQPQLQQPEISSSPSSTLTTSSNTTTSLASTSCTSSNNQNNNTATNDKEDENPATPPAAAPHPTEPAPDMDDLYLLVTRGVDFLQSRESSKWDDEGGYEFHPWNRPDGSFAVRKKSQVSLVEELQPQQQQPLPTVEQQAASEDEEDKASSTNSTKNEEATPPKERSNSTSSKLSSSRQQQVRHPAAPPSQNEKLIDEQELQRIVAAHIVF